MKVGRQTETGRLRSVLLKHPREAFGDQQRIDRQWQKLNYSAAPDFARALAEYEKFDRLLQQQGVERHYLPAAPGVGLDSIYVRDAAVVCNRGIILGSMGKPLRRKEPQALKEALAGRGVPILGEISGDGRLEGGDAVWLNEHTLAVGRGYRTNQEGIRQLRELLGDVVEELLVVPLPHWRGPEDVFHLMSILSPLDRHLALVYSPLLPVSFREELLGRGIELVEVVPEEFETMGGNVLALGPRRCLMLSGNPRTRRRLESAGVQVWEYRGEEISRKGSGGPTCLTRPLWRE